MSLGDDERAVSIQVGAILLFALLVILLILNQAFVVPNQNRQVEANHLETITAEMQELRDAIVSMPSSGVDRSVTLTLGTTYPARTIATNPGPASGAVRTRGTSDADVNLTVAGAVATDGETDDVWNGTNRTYATGALLYQPGYNEFRNAPTIVYDNTLLVHRFRSGNLTRAGQRLVDGDRLTLLTLNGSLDTATTSGVSVDLQAVSASDRRITVSNQTGDNVTVSFASQFDAATWEGRFVDDGELTNQSGHVVGVTESPIPGTDFDRIHVELAGDVTYTLRMAKVGVGTGVAGEPVNYLALPAGDERTVQEGSRTTLVVEARDALNNPVTGATVHARLEAGGENGTLLESAVTSDDDGRATFVYEAVDVDGASPTFQVNFSHLGRPDSAFDPAAAANASMNVTIQNTDGSGVSGGGGGGGAYTTSWLDPSGQTGVTCPNGPDDTCTVDASQAGSPTLTMGTSPVADGAQVQYAVNDTNVGTLTRTTGTTDGNGENSTAFTPAMTGGVKVYTSSGGSGDALVLRVINVVEDLIYNNDASADPPGYAGISDQALVSFTVTNQHSSTITITDFTLNSTSINPSGQIREDQGGDIHEVWVDTDGDGTPEGEADLFFDSVNEGETVALDTQATMATGSTAEVRLYHFQQSSNGSPVDMVGEDATIAIHYVDGSGTSHTKTITMTNIPD